MDPTTLTDEELMQYAPTDAWTQELCKRLERAHGARRLLRQMRDAWVPHTYRNDHDEELDLEATAFLHD